MLRRKLSAAVVVTATLAAGLVVVPSPAFATGSGYYEIISVADNSDQIVAYRNVNGFNGPMFANPGVPVGFGWSTDNDVAFADIDGDTWDDLIDIGTNGVVRAWRNNGAGQYPGAPVQIATGFVHGQNRTRFADIDGDGRDEIIAFQYNNEVWAWTNMGGGFANAYTGGYRIIGYGWDDPNRAWFADIDGDGRDEIIEMRRVTAFYGDLWAWRNVNGWYTGGAVRIGEGWDELYPDTVNFGDLDSDGRYEVIYVPYSRGSVWAWRNVGGYVQDGTYTQPPVQIGEGWRTGRTYFAEVLPR